MWQCLSNSVVFLPGKNLVQLGIIDPDWGLFAGEVFHIPETNTSPQGFDDWLGNFPREDETQLVQKAIQEIQKHNTRIHIRGLSTLESVQLIREHYAQKGYEDILQKNYTLPDDELLTFSISLRHALWCEKDKNFLSKKERTLYDRAPPLRSPADLRALQQALRMGMVTGIEVFPGDEMYLPPILQKQILSVYQIGKMVHFNWGRHGFTGKIREYSFELPEFIEE